MYFFYLLIFFGSIVSIQFVYYIFIFGKFSFKKNIPISPKKVPVSILVCAKNESKNIENLLPLLLNQQYPEFEIVLIDDASSDDTLDIFEKFQKENKNIKIVKVVNNEAFWGNKKYALTLGIKAASNPYLVFIDADCKPKSEHWLTQITSHFSASKTIVLGYGAYKKVKNSLLNKLIRFETLLTATQYFSWAILGKPYMGVGRNLAYKKDEFFKVRGFMDHMKIRSGDDDLFINQAASKMNTTICFTPESFTISHPKKTFKSWFYQKRRHATTGQYYKLFDKFQLGVFQISQLLFFVLASLLLAFSYEWIWVTGLLLFRYIFTWISIGYAAKKLDEKDIVLWYPIYEILLLIVLMSVFLRNLISKPIHWK